MKMKRWERDMKEQKWRNRKAKRVNKASFWGGMETYTGKDSTLRGKEASKDQRSQRVFYTRLMKRRFMHQLYGNKKESTPSFYVDLYRKKQSGRQTFHLTLHWILLPNDWYLRVRRR